MSLLPTVLEDLIIDYKMGLNSVLKHQIQMKECVKKINKIKHSYKYNPEYECYETTMKKNNMETMFYIHVDRNDDEIEMSYIGKSGCHKYWCFQNDRLDEYYKI